ncbi:MAG: hypothetical protein KGQ49_01580 [Verrucomicrobia bacterium]|nr:hypothetical protein [Verrucomicrobiota bacterium]MBU6446073.1 hypothetical protein [Verrucomicrobiota bacterium]MDE3047604.1 hypothetical protein [Verrucomicrobiota bacterium]
MNRSVEWGRGVWAPEANPAGTLRRVNEISTDCLHRTAILGISPPLSPTALNGQLDAVLQQRGIGPTPNPRIREVGEVADLGPHTDPEATRAPRLQARVEATDWETRQKLYQEKLKDKLAVFTALCQMRDRAGIVEKNNLQLMGLVKQATEGANPVSVWDLFVKHYQPSFLQILSAGWFYWIYYMTSLIHNTLDAYLVSFIEHITSKLTTESDATRQSVFRELIANANDFLLRDFRATERYANGTEVGSLDQIRTKAIEEHYNSSIPALCESLSAYLVNHTPPVRFFKDFQKIPILKYPFILFEYLMNRLVVQHAMKHMILPAVLEKAIHKGLEATQPDKLPFAIALTKFFTEQLQKLRTIVENESDLDEQRAENYPGTELLPPTIQLLMNVLDVEGNYTPDELKEKLKPVRRERAIDATVKQAIAKGVTEGVNKLFWELNRSARSHELFAKLIELTLAPFSDEVKTEEALRSEYETEVSKFQRTARSVFQRIARNEVSKVLKAATPSEQMGQIAFDSLSAQKAIVHELVEKMGSACLRLEEKIAEAEPSASHGEQVQAEIASLFQILQVLSARRELQNQNEKLDATHQNEIRRRFAPLYKDMEDILDHLRRLQDEQYEYTRHQSALTSLQDAGVVLTTIQGEFLAQANLSQNTRIQSLKEALKELTKTLGADAPIVIRLKEITNAVALHSTHLAKERSVIEAIHALYPPRGAPQQVGLIDQLLQHQGGSLPQFRPRECMARIANHLACFPQDEQSQQEKRDLERIIGDGSDMQSKMPLLSHELQSIYARHCRSKEQRVAELGEVLTKSIQWSAEKVDAYNRIKTQNHIKMREEANLLSTRMGSLQQREAKITTVLTAPISNTLFKIGTCAAPLVGAYFLPHLATAGLSLVGGAAYRYLKGSSNDTHDGVFRSALKQGGLVAAAAAGAWWMPSQMAEGVPYVQAIANYGAGMLGGAKLVEAFQPALEKRVFDRVWDVFNKAYDLSLHPRVYQAAATRTLKALVSSEG